MLDIFEYFNSPDVAAHCKSIGKTFEPLEAAVIVYYYRGGVLKREAGFQAVIDSTGDVPVPATRLNDALPSLHDCIKKLLDAQVKVREFFMTAEPRDVYYAVCRECRGGYSDDAPINKLGPFSSFEKALRELNDEYGADGADFRNFHCEITKEVVDSRKSAGFAVSPDGTLLCCTGHSDLLNKYERDICDLFENFYIYVPTPFKRGDIVGSETVRRTEEGPVVLESLCYEDEKQHERHLCEGDGSDMIFHYYSGRNSAVFQDHGPVYFDLTYFRDKLPRELRILGCISAFLKGELELDILINLARLLEHEQYALDDCEMKNTRSFIELCKEGCKNSPGAWQKYSWLAELFQDK